MHESEPFASHALCITTRSGTLAAAGGGVASTSGSAHEAAAVTEPAGKGEDDLGEETGTGDERGSVYQATQPPR